jgi:hypothetical protein
MIRPIQDLVDSLNELGGRAGDKIAKLVREIMKEETSGSVNATHRENPPAPVSPESAAPSGESDAPPATGPFEVKSPERLFLRSSTFAFGRRWVESETSEGVEYVRLDVVTKMLAAVKADIDSGLTSGHSVGGIQGAENPERVSLSRARTAFWGVQFCSTFGVRRFKDPVVEYVRADLVDKMGEKAEAYQHQLEARIVELESETPSGKQWRGWLLGNDASPVERIRLRKAAFTAEKVRWMEADVGDSQSVEYVRADKVVAAYVVSNQQSLIAKLEKELADVKACLDFYRDLPVEGVKRVTVRDGERVEIFHVGGGGGTLGGDLDHGVHRGFGGGGGAR